MKAIQVVNTWILRLTAEELSILSSYLVVSVSLYVHLFSVARWLASRACDPCCEARQSLSRAGSQGSQVEPASRTLTLVLACLLASPSSACGVASRHLILIAGVIETGPLGAIVLVHNIISLLPSPCPQGFL
jgi:hypothetical protein